VLEEIEKLKKGLGERKKLKEMPADVEKARSELVSCLRLNDRTPLDCWKEVEVFKGLVGRMEEEFVGTVL
jgi:MICOS complex subunit MIC19